MSYIIYTGYEIAKMLSTGQIPEGSFLQQYVNGETSDYEEIYIIYQQSLWTVKGDNNLTRDYEVGNSMLTSFNIRFEIVKRCENCGDFIHEETYHKYHGHCSSQCEKKSIDKYNSEVINNILESSKGINIRDYFSNLDINHSTVTLEDREIFFKNMTDDDIQKINTLLKNNKLRFF